ncbi:hypothetical protein COCMIDRAFT_37649 [Bipolaris oryzae ATCC 44560]|uniref:Uncharacterized protein n=1 Tax=Bipolaris oryzae ATCC 44560 TaxID=930090 RepID=W6ZLV0_COCMI|nr:uncharacterized protein COCMIDRAFT_37649 [Bipolaris oryzae ATCC 44560]EUC44561.1 hypothetical protein COCMIDRAFT_37649 [Bipolaris oryzae ATCC 44560]
MRIDIVFTFTSLLGMTDALRRSRRHNPRNWGKGRNDFNTHLPPGINLGLPCLPRRRYCRRNSPNGDGAYAIVSGGTLNSIAGIFCTIEDALAVENLHFIRNKAGIRTGWVIQDPCSFNQQSSSYRQYY